ncbi:MAG: M20/M25/M40 family metallo-hydrolase [Sulfolobales archaeon]
MEEEVLSILTYLVSIPSVNDPVRGIKPSADTAKYIYDFLTQHGIDASIIESNGYYSIMGSVGVGKPYIMLLAHYDVVPVEGQDWSYDPFKLNIVGDRAYGRGALDDKSNVAAFMVVLKELSRLDLNRRVLFAFTGDEEVGGENGAQLIAEKLVSSNSLPRYLINGDGANHTVICRRRKSFEVILRIPKKLVVVRGVKGFKTFLANYPVSQHAHAAYFIAGVDTHPLLCASVFTRESDIYITQLSGNFVKSNVVPQYVSLEYVTPNHSGSEYSVDMGLTDLIKSVLILSRVPINVKAFSEYGVSITPNMYFFDGKHNLVLDVRAMSSKDVIEESFKAVLNETSLDAELLVRSDVGGYMNTCKDSVLVKTFEEVLANLNLSYRVGEGAGASDSRYFVVHGVNAVDFGPLGGGMHGSNEYVDVSSLKILPKIYLEVIKKLLMVEEKF